MNRFPQISEAEFEIMKVIWDNNPINTKEIVDIVTKSSSWNMRTIHTLIARLEKKGAISHKKEGRIYSYSPIVKKEDYINSESKSFLNKFYNGAANKMVMNFIENDMLSSRDIQELKNILNKKE
ncbi:MAG: BlaI/MecI/CopY family transcriptional regulator [Clostridia bacterium]|nr:BlaI/MecI/CopY family transcriptional regulator [Clostridia bacterium]